MLYYTGWKGNNLPNFNSKFLLLWITRKSNTKTLKSLQFSRKKYFYPKTLSSLIWTSVHQRLLIYGYIHRKFSKHFAQSTPISEGSKHSWCDVATSNSTEKATNCGFLKFNLHKNCWFYWNSPKEKLLFIQFSMNIAIN